MYFTTWIYYFLAFFKTLQLRPSKVTISDLLRHLLYSKQTPQQVRCDKNTATNSITNN